MTFVGGMDLETFMASGFARFARFATTAGTPGTEGLLLGAATMAGAAGAAGALGLATMAAMAGALGVAGVAGVVVAALAAGASAPGEASARGDSATSFATTPLKLRMMGLLRFGSCTIGRAITFGGPKTLVVSGLMQFTSAGM